LTRLEINESLNELLPENTSSTLLNHDHQNQIDLNYNITDLIHESGLLLNSNNQEFYSINTESNDNNTILSNALNGPETLSQLLIDHTPFNDEDHTQVVGSLDQHLETVA
jgi:ribosome assembly protein YihI (activator of Der GTPase)